MSRELTRGIAAFALYLLFCFLSMQSGLYDLYSRLLTRFGEAIVVAVQHFSVIPSFGNQILRGSQSLIMLSLALGLLSTRVRWRRRLWLFGALLAAVLLVDILTASLAIQLRMAQETFQQQHMLLMLPWESRIVGGLWYLLYMIPLHAGPFILIVLVAIWNGRSRRLESRSARYPDLGSSKVARSKSPARMKLRWARRIVFPGLAASLVLALVVPIWIGLRESDPRHIHAHVVLGSLAFEEGDLGRAKQEYWAAIDEGSTEGSAWYRVSLILGQEGDANGAAQLLKRSLGVVTDPTWRGRIRKAALSVREAGGDGQPDSTIVVRPSASRSE